MSNTSTYTNISLEDTPIDNLNDYSKTIYKIIYLLTRIFSLVSLILVFVWVALDNNNNSNLGGLYPINMSDPNSDNFKYVFNWHPVMMILGMLFCLVEACLSYKTWNHLGTIRGIKIAKLIHLIWQTAAVICISVGLIAVFLSHNKIDPDNPSTYKANLYSLHSWIGIAVITMYYAQYIVALYTFLTPFSVSSISNRENYKPYHIYFGLFLLFAAGMAIESGIQEKLTLLTFSGISCSANVPTDEADINPAKYYQQMPLVCKKANWLGLSVFITIMFAGLSIFLISGSKTSLKSSLLENEVNYKKKNYIDV